MGNGLSPCLHMPATATRPAAARLVYWGGQTRLLPVADDGEDDNGGGSFTAGDVSAELAAEHIVCAAESFFVGLPIPVVAPAERLLPGQAYFVLPAARFSAATRLTAATLASLAPPAPGKKKNKNLLAVRLAGPDQCPFEYVKGAEDGAAPLIRVLPEFIEKVITCSDGNGGDGNGNGATAAGGGRRRGRSKCSAPATETRDELCSTPELKRHYAQLVGPRSRPWSPALETISEGGKRSVLWSPARLLLNSR